MDVNLEVDLAKYNLIMTSLGERPAKEVIALINELNKQVQEQVNAAQQEQAQQEQEINDLKKRIAEEEAPAIKTTRRAQLEKELKSLDGNKDN